MMLLSPLQGGGSPTGINDYDGRVNAPGFRKAKEHKKHQNEQIFLTKFWTSGDKEYAEQSFPHHFIDLALQKKKVVNMH